MRLSLELTVTAPIAKSKSNLANAYLQPPYPEMAVMEVMADILNASAPPAMAMRDTLNFPFIPEPSSFFQGLSKALCLAAVQSQWPKH